MNSFWQALSKGFFALAPMEDVTDTCFREIVLSISNKNVLKVLFTEFTSTDGLCSSKGFGNVSKRLEVNSSELELLKHGNIKLVAQLWGNNPELFYKSARLIESMGSFDGIDINMGCPVKKVIKRNTCSALIKQPLLAREIIHATQSATYLPVSVKTRIGFNKVETESWVSHLLESKIDALTVHGRTQKMQSEGLADWNEIKKAVDIRNNLNIKTKIIGNGDILSYQQGTEKIEIAGVDGIMVGRGIFKNPWLFNSVTTNIKIEEKIALLLKHLHLFRKTWENKRNYNELKRFFKIYIQGFNGAAEIRNRLMETKSIFESIEILNKAAMFNFAI